jgi:hypothetical protein
MSLTSINPGDGRSHALPERATFGLSLSRGTRYNERSHTRLGQATLGSSRARVTRYNRP